MAQLFITHYKIMKKLISIILSLMVVLSCCMLCTACDKTQGQSIKVLVGEDLISETPYVKWEGRDSYTEAQNNQPAKVN